MLVPKRNAVFFLISNIIWFPINCWSSDSCLIELLELFFSIRVFFHRRWQLTGQQGKGEDHLLFHSTTSTNSRSFRHLFATLHVRWLSHIFNCNVFNYHTSTWWDLSPYRITIWLIDNVMLIFICLLVDLILVFVTAIWHERNRWTWTRLTKSFDRVWNADLLHKLRTYGILGQIFSLISSFLSNKPHHVVLDGKSSEENPVNVGVP